MPREQHVTVSILPVRWTRCRHLPAGVPITFSCNISLDHVLCVEETTHYFLVVLLLLLLCRVSWSPMQPVFCRGQEESVHFFLWVWFPCRYGQYHSSGIRNNNRAFFIYFFNPTFQCCHVNYAMYHDIIFLQY